MKLKEYKPKYSILELMVNEWGEYLTPYQMLKMTTAIRKIKYKDAIKKYGELEVASVKDYDDTNTTSIILMGERWANRC